MVKLEPRETLEPLVPKVDKVSRVPKDTAVTKADRVRLVQQAPVATRDPWG